MNTDIKNQWMPLREAAKLVGLQSRSAHNQAIKGRFCVPTFKLGRTRVVSRAALEEFFELKKQEAIAVLRSKDVKTPPPEEPKRRRKRKRGRPRKKR